MTRTATFTIALYAIFVASWAAVAVLPSTCPAPLTGWTVQISSLLDVLPFGLIALMVAQRLRRRRYVLPPGWCSQTLIWPLLLMGLVGTALAAGCGPLESSHPTLDPFVTALHGSIWALRSQLALLAGLAGVVLFHLCARRTNAAS